MANRRPIENKIGSLNSWKEISLYLGRGIRTVQRWERELGLPVHRIGSGARSPVHAFPSELRAWHLRIGKRQAGVAPQDGHAAILMHPDGAVAASQVLVNRSSSLVKQMVESLWLQQRRAQELLDVMEKFRQRMHKQLGRTDGVVRLSKPPSRPGKRPRKK